MGTKMELKRKILIVLFGVAVLFIIITVVSFSKSKDQFYENPINGKNILGRPCNKSDECDKEKYLICKDGKCVCDEKRSIQCRGIPGVKCNSNVSICVQGAVCKHGRCQCGDGYVETEHKNCRVIGGEKCIPNSDICVNNLKCFGPTKSEMTCGCLKPSDERLDPTKLFCSPKIGRKCDPDSKLPPCGNDGLCVNSSRTSNYICDCLGGFTSNGKGDCELGYGMECHDQLPCSSYRLLVCKFNPHVGVETCDCRNEGDIYDDQRRGCIRSVGQVCEHDGNCAINTTCSDGKCKRLYLGSKVPNYFVRN